MIRLDIIFKKLTSRNREAKPIPMTWQEQKPNTKPILFCRKISTLNQILRKPYSRYLKIPRKYQEIRDRNAKYRFAVGIFLVGIPFFLLPIDITRSNVNARKSFKFFFCFNPSRPAANDQRQGVKITALTQLKLR